VLVFASDLKKVKEIGCSGVDADYILIFGWGWVWEFSHSELFWTLELLIFLYRAGIGACLDVFFDLDATHLEDG
jgi:hypothetical protein